MRYFNIDYTDSFQYNISNKIIIFKRFEQFLNNPIPDFLNFS